MALTPKGRALYDELLNQGRAQTAGLDNDAHQAIMERVFAAFPDHHEAIRTEQLAYFHYHLTDAGRAAKGRAEHADLETLLAQGGSRPSPSPTKIFYPSVPPVFSNPIWAAAKTALTPVTQTATPSKPPWAPRCRMSWRCMPNANSARKRP